MNILQIGTIDTRGGAGKLSWLLKNELVSRGYTVPMFVGYKYSQDPEVYTIPLNPLYTKLSRLLADDTRFSFSDSILKHPVYKKADIVHFHNIHSGFFNLKTFQKITREKPCVWTLHDMWPITAGCTDLYNCSIEKPRRVLKYLWDNRSTTLERKRRTYQQSIFHAVTPSTWLKELAEQDMMKNIPIHLIPNGVNTAIYRPRNKEDVREKLNLPIDKKIVLTFATKGMDYTSKTGVHTHQAVKDLSDNPDVLFVSIGHKHPDTTQKKVIEVGFIEDEELLSQYYSSADALFYPSLGDNCPLVVVEAMACGLPVISFDTGGIPEIVSDTGYIAEYGNSYDLINGLKKILSLPKEQYTKLVMKCTDRITSTFSLETMTNSYVGLYQKVISEHAQRQLK